MGPHLKICSNKLPVNISPHKNVLNMIHPEDVFEEYIDHICIYTYTFRLGFSFYCRPCAAGGHWRFSFGMSRVRRPQGGIKPVGPTVPQLFSPEPGSSSCRAFRAGFAACKLQWQSHSQKIMNHQLRNLDPLGRFLKQTPPKKTPAQDHCILFHLRPEPSTFLAAAADTREAEAMVKGHTRPRPDHTIHTCTQLHR